MAGDDVVPPGDLEKWEGGPYELRVDGDVIYGRGVEDNHQGLVAGVMAARAMVEQGIKPKYDLALLFVAERPLSRAELRTVARLSAEEVDERLGDLEVQLSDRGIRLVSSGDRVMLGTSAESGQLIARYLGADAVRLSPAALETLAIIAYRQPISRVEIEDIRGVGSTTVLRTLQEWELVDITGRGEGLGRPLLYGTTRRLLDHFGLRDLADLPRLEDLPVTLQAERTLEVPPEAQMTDAEDETVVAAEAELEVATATPTEAEAAETPAPPEAGAPEAEAETSRPAEGSPSPEDEAGETDDAAQPDTQEPATV